MKESCFVIWIQPKEDVLEYGKIQSRGCCGGAQRAKVLWRSLADYIGCGGPTGAGES